MINSMNILEQLSQKQQLERWKETPLNKILAFKWQKATRQETYNSGQMTLPDNAIVIPLINGFIDEQRFNIHDLPVGILLKNHQQQLEITILKNEKIEQAIILQQENIANSANIKEDHKQHCEVNIKITLEENAQAHFLMFESGLGEILYTPHISLDLLDNAICEWIRVGLNAEESYNLVDIQIKQAQGSQLIGYNYQNGGNIARCDLSVASRGQNVQTHLSALNLAKGKQHFSYVVDVNHEIENCISDQQVRNIVQDQAMVLFDGCIKVQPNAQKTDAQQLTKTILLSEKARVLTVPRLEIYADDVKCSHGATIGELDTEAMFYLRSRGLNEVQAKKILIQAFAEALIMEIRHQALQKWCLERFSQDLMLMIG